MKCEFSNPVDLGGGDFEFSELICNADYETLISSSTEATSTADFVIKKEYSYGDISLLFLIGFLGLIFIFYILKRIFTHENVRVAQLHQKRF